MIDGYPVLPAKYTVLARDNNTYEILEWNTDSQLMTDDNCYHSVCVCENEYAALHLVVMLLKENPDEKSVL